MFAAKLFPLAEKVRIISQSEREALSMSDKVLLEVIRLRQDAIWRRGRNKLNRYWDTFVTDQGSDPFGPHSRVEIHVLTSMVGRWRNGGVLGSKQCGVGRYAPPTELRS
jgi:hypothetical protein